MKIKVNAANLERLTYLRNYDLNEAMLLKSIQISILSLIIKMPFLKERDKIVKKLIRINGLNILTIIYINKKILL